MCPRDFVELDILTKAEWDARVSHTGRCPQVESAIVQLPSGEWMLSRNSGKGARSQSAAPSARNALYTCDPITGQQGHLFGLNFDGAKKAHEILMTCDTTGLVDRAHYTSNSVLRTSHALFIRSRNVKFICKDRKIMFAPPYLRTNNCQGLSNVPSIGEGGKLSNFFTNLMTSLFKDLSTGCEKLLRFRLREPITIEKLGLSVGAATVARRWSMKPEMELTIRNVKRALSMSVLSARDASRSWTATGGFSFNSASQIVISEAYSHSKKRKRYDDIDSDDSVVGDSDDDDDDETSSEAHSNNKKRKRHDVLPPSDVGKGPNSCIM
jgi:hypothetical protein